MTIEQPDYKRAVQIVVYDLQGGPFPEKALNRLMWEVEQLAKDFDGLAITVVHE